MSSIATVSAPSNIAFIKYWGTRDLDHTLPYNPSLSMTLAECVSRCTVEHRPEQSGHEVLLGVSGEFAPAPEDFAAGVKRHLDRLAAWADVGGGFRVATENSFPTGAGMASSASGFAALTLAAAAAVGHELDPATASVLARSSGSGSAARSVLGGYVEWPAGEAGLDDPDAPAVQVAPAEHWALCDVVAVVDSSPKEISSREGHRRAPSSASWPARLEALPRRLEQTRAAIAARSLADLGPVIEEEAIELHLIAMSSRPGIFYWSAGTIEVLQRLDKWRADGLDVYATIDAGPNVHLICEPRTVAPLVAELESLTCVESVISDRVGNGPQTLAEPLV